MKNNKIKKILSIIVLALFMFSIFVQAYKFKTKEMKISYNDFLEKLDKDLVVKVIIDEKASAFNFEYIDEDLLFKEDKKLPDSEKSKRIQNFKKDLKEEKEDINRDNIKLARTDNPKKEGFKEILLKKDVEYIEMKSTSFANILAVMFNIIFYSILLTVLLKSTNFKVNKFEKTTEEIKDIDIGFSDIAGNENAKRDIEHMVKGMLEPERYEDMGAKLPRGILLYGSPGTGKTLMAKAIAGESGLPFYSANGSDFVELFVGMGAKRVRNLFEEAKKNAPCVLFIDEIDSIGGKRGAVDSNSEREQTLNALLGELDGFDTKSGVVVIAATNRVEDLDPALIRPGRFDRQIAIELPNRKDRVEILKVHAKDKKLSEEVSLNKLADMTVGFSGAALEALLNEATINAINRDSNLVTMEDIDEAYYKILTKGNKDTTSERSKEEIDIVAHHEAGHTVMAKLLTKNKVPKVTIIPSTSGAGGITFNIPHKTSLLSKKDIKNEIMILYGGRAAEEVFLGDRELVTTGASNDIERATKLIYSYFLQYGMSDSYGLITHINEDSFNDPKLRDLAREMADNLYSDTVNILKENKEKLFNLANELIEKETLEEEEIDRILTNS